MATFSQKCARALKAKYNINYMPALQVAQRLLAESDFRTKMVALAETDKLDRVEAFCQLAKPTIDAEFE